MKKGLIMKSLSGFYDVMYKEKIYTCRANGTLRVNKKHPLVGDYVDFEIIDSTTGKIFGIHKRLNQMKRPPVANINYALVVFSIVEPNFNFMLADKILLECYGNNVEPILIITKLDLEYSEEIIKKIKYYETFMRVIYKNGNIYDDIKKEIDENIAFVIGQSGVGKSTMLNELDSDINIATNEISLKMNRGKHTTRHSEIYNVRGLLVADTPGFGYMETEFKDKTDIAKLYPDFIKLAVNCKFNGCTHTHEPSCAVKKAVENEVVELYRYNNYLKIFEEEKNKIKKY